MSKLTDNIEAKIVVDVETLGYELEYTEYVKEGESKIYRVVIDKPGESLTTDDCEVVSRKIEDTVDSLMAKDEAYVLEVSSPGLERALKNNKLYKKYIGNNVRIKLYKKVEDVKELVGTLVESKEDYIVLLVEDKQIKIERENIACGNTVYEFWEE
jgi:ribosome maturation factor RimP